MLRMEYKISNRNIYYLMCWILTNVWTKITRFLNITNTKSDNKSTLLSFGTDSERKTIIILHYAMHWSNLVMKILNINIDWLSCCKREF